MPPTTKAEHEGGAENGDNAKRTTQLPAPSAGRAIALTPLESDTSGAGRTGESRKDAADPPCKATIPNHENKEQNGENRSAPNQCRRHPGRAMVGSVRNRPPRGWTGLSTGRDAGQRRMTLSPYPVANASRAKPS
jgi:hypothetical protein